MKGERHLDDREVGRLWDQNADVWTMLARMGCDIYRDFLNTPAFLNMLPDVSGLRGLDVGCGEGHNTRLVAQRGAKMTAADIAPTFVRHAQDKEDEEPLGITYVAASGADLPFDDESFDFAVAFMSLMDMANHEDAIREAYRVLKPGGFIQFSIIHPCFWTADLRWIRNEAGEPIGVLCRDYFEGHTKVQEWLFAAAPEEAKVGLPKFRVPRFSRTLSEWVNPLAEAGFRIEEMREPYADEESAKRFPRLAKSRMVALFLHVRCRK